MRPGLSLAGLVHGVRNVDLQGSEVPTDKRQPHSWRFDGFGVAGQVPERGGAPRTALQVAASSIQSISGSVKGVLGGDGALAAAVLDTTATVACLAGDERIVRWMAGRGLAAGSCWSEAAAGPNAAEQSVRERGVFVTPSNERPGAPLGGFTMAAAPLFGHDRALEGCVALLAHRGVEPAILWSLAVLCAETASAQVALSVRNEGLRRSLAEQVAIIENISDGLLVVERDGRVHHMNGPAGRILNLVPDESVGRRFSDLLDFEPILGPVFLSGTGYYDRELIIDTPTRHLHLMDTVIPIKNEAGEVEAVVNTFREIQRARRMAHEMAGSQARYTFADIIGSSDALRHAVDRARKAARGTANILLTGESGTGKEVFAQALHAASSRAQGPFVAINCAALPRDLIESELFGFAAGSFTGAHRTGRPGKFELASAGTIFLDEITEMPLDVQAKLLRVLQEREVTRIGDSRAIPIDVRLVSACNRDIRALVQRREFREDLYYRLDVVGIAIPSLRERASDIELLANHFLRRYATALNKKLFRLSDQARRQILAYDWPGNIRQLENTVERIVNLSDDGAELEFDLPTREIHPRKPTVSAPLRTLREVEHDAIRAALSECRDNVTQAASALGISRGTLYAKISEYAIPLSRTERAGRSGVPSNSAY